MAGGSSGITSMDETLRLLRKLQKHLPGENSMRIIVIHSEHGDTVAIVTRTRELIAMGITYTEVIPSPAVATILKCNPDLMEDLQNFWKIIVEKLNSDFDLNSLYGWINSFR